MQIAITTLSGEVHKVNHNDPWSLVAKAKDKGWLDLRWAVEDHIDAAASANVLVIPWAQIKSFYFTIAQKRQDSHG